MDHSYFGSNSKMAGPLSLTAYQTSAVLNKPVSNRYVCSPRRDSSCAQFMWATLLLKAIHSETEGKTCYRHFLLRTKPGGGTSPTSGEDSIVHSVYISACALSTVWKLAPAFDRSTWNPLWQRISAHHAWNCSCTTMGMLCKTCALCHTAPSLHFTLHKVAM